MDPANTGYVLTEQDRDLITRVVENYLQRRGNTQGRPHGFEEQITAPEVYVARTPAGGIPALTDEGGGAGTGTDTYDEPSFADCDIFRVAASNWDGMPELQPAGFTRPVGNLSKVAVVGSSWALVERDKFGQWWVVGGEGAGGSAVVLILDVTIGAQSYNALCGTGSGFGCREIFQNAMIQTSDPVCDHWVNGACVTVIDANSKRLEIGRRYVAKLIGTTPTAVSATISPVGGPLCTGSSNALYLVDAGSLDRVISVTSHYGTLCVTGVGTGTGTTSAPSSTDLDIYRGQAVRWNPGTCNWDLIEDDVLVAHVSGCALTIGTRYMSHWHTNVPAVDLGGAGTGSGSSTCTPLYLTQVRIGQYVTDVLCVGGVLKVYKSTTDCGDSVYSHDAGCCACGSVGTGSSSGGAGCPCSGVPSAAHFHVGTFALTNASCSNCTSFPASFDLTQTGACAWNSGTLPNPCGASAGAALTYDSVHNTFDLYIGTGTFAAHYQIAAGSFACNGVNVLSIVSADTGPGCGGWPATVTITPF